MSELETLSEVAAEKWYGKPGNNRKLTNVIADTFRPLAERAEKLEALLRRLEWAGFEHRCCPLCGGYSGHNDDCELAALLAPEPPQVFEAEPKNIRVDPAAVRTATWPVKDAGPTTDDVENVTADVDLDPLLELRRATWNELVSRIEGLEQQLIRMRWKHRHSWTAHAVDADRLIEELVRIGSEMLKQD